VSKRVPVFDSFAHKVLFFTSRTKAESMLENRSACILSQRPLEIRLRSGQTSRAAHQLLTPDRSLTVGPAVVHAAAASDPHCQQIVEGRRTPRYAHRFSPEKN
jgi:hypothetical protein